MMSTACAREYRLGADTIEAPDAALIDLPPGQPLEPRSSIRVLIANHQPIVRYGLRALLAIEPDFDVVGEAENGGAAVRMARQLRPDVVMIDLLMPDLDGITATRMIRAEIPSSKVIVMTGTDEDVPAIESIRAGASAYLLDSAGNEMMLQAIRAASVGQVALPAHAAGRLARVADRLDALSRRESEVLRLVAHGMANRQIARELGISESTVKSHVYSIFGKLSMVSRIQAAMFATRIGLISQEKSNIG
jgi:NarL family two-component system response regulator LiaR